MYRMQDDGRAALAAFKQEELEAKTLDDLWNIVTAYQDKARVKREERLLQLQRRKDYFERLRRTAEIPKRERLVAAELQQRKDKREAEIEHVRHRQIAQHENMLALKQKFEKLRKPTEAFIESIVGPRRAEFEARLEAFEAAFEEQQRRKEREAEQRRREYERSQEYQDELRRQAEQEERERIEEERRLEEQRLIEQGHSLA